MTNRELNRMGKFKAPKKLSDLKTEKYEVNCDGEIKEGVKILDLVSQVVAPITFAYVDGTFLAPTAFDHTSKTGYGEHKFRKTGCGKQWVFIKKR